VIADKLDQKKIDKKEIEILKLFDLISFNLDKVNTEYIDNPEKLLIEEKVDKKHQNTVNELIELLKSDLYEINLYNKFKFQILIIESFRLKRTLNGSPIAKSVTVFIENVEDCRQKPTNKKIESIYAKYRKHLVHRFGDIDSWEFIKVLKEAKLLVDPIINELRGKVDQSKGYFIESVLYNLLENKFVFYYILDYYRPTIQPIFQEVLKDMILEIKSLHPDFLDKLDLNKIDKYKKMFQEQKDSLIPPSFSENIGMEQGDMLKLQAKGLEFFSLLSFDILFEDIKDAFVFKKYSKIGFASVLYDFFLITHRVHPAYEFYTKEEWWDEQDKIGNIPTNRKWKNHMLFRVKNIIPNF